MKLISKKQDEKLIYINLESVNLLDVSKQDVHKFYNKYLINISNNKERLLKRHLEKGFKKNDFIFPEEIYETLFYSFQRQMKKQFKVNTLNCFLKAGAFKEINTVILQETIKHIFFNRGIDKNFISEKMKEYSHLYEKPRRNEVLHLVFSRDIGYIQKQFNRNVYMSNSEALAIYNAVEKSGISYD